MREIRTSGATRGEVALRVLPYSTGENPAVFCVLPFQDVS